MLFLVVAIFVLIAFGIVGALIRTAGAMGAAGSAMIQSARSTESEDWFTEAKARGLAMRAAREQLEQPWKG